MTTRHQTEIHHGVLMNISGYGVLIIGSAGIGKSSLALEFLHHGHQLIADDAVEFTNRNTHVSGKSPVMLSGLLHCRELGLISVTDLFGSESWQSQTNLDYVIQLQKNLIQPSAITPELAPYSICGKDFPQLNLDINTPASLHHRVITWLSIQTSNNHAETTLHHRQRTEMTTLFANRHRKHS